MTDELMYFHLHTSTMNPCSMEKSASKAAKNSWLCRGCNYPKPNTQAIDVTIQGLKEPDDPPLNFVYGFGIPLAHKDFLLSFGEDIVVRDLRLGRVFLSNGRPLDNWVTFQGRYRLIIRGTKNVSYRQCSECGRHVYFAMGPRYLYPAPPADAAMFESDLSGLIVSKELFERAVLHRWRKLVCERLPVLVVPKDGLSQLASI